MSARHVSLLAALAAIWGGSYLLIKYALDGYSAAMIVVRPLPARVRGAVRRAALDGHRGPCPARHPRAAEVGADPEHHRGHRAVPADHVRRARRAERADRGADLARVAVHRAARAVPAPQRADRPPPGRRHAARPGGRDRRRRRRVRAVAEGVPRRAGDDRRGVLLRALELRREGPVRLAGRGPDVVDQRHDRGHRDAAVRDRHHAGPHARPRRRRPRSSCSACSAPRSRSSSTTS